MPYSDQTLKDCRLLTGADSTSSLFHFFNHTATNGGADALEDMIKDKKSSVREILDVQEAIIYTMRHVGELDPGLHNSDIHYLQEYFRLDVNFADGDILSNLIGRFNLSPDPTFHLIRSNILRLSLFLKSVRNISRSGNGEQPRLLKEIFDTLNRCLNHEGIGELLKEDLDEEGRSYFIRADRFLRQDYSSSFTELLDALFRLEAFVSIAKTALAAQLLFPSVGESRSLQLEGCYHPLLKGAVKNDVETDETTRLFFLTGANMAGKSTFLRTVGSIVALAHSGFPVPASLANMPFYDEIVVHINAEDNVEQGYSQFYNEVSMVKAVLNNISSGQSCFAVFDEIFSGTNPDDAVECCRIVFERVKVRGTSLFMLSSHNIQLAGGGKQDHARFNFVQTHLVDGKPEFTYRLLPGINEVKLGSILFNQI